MRRLEGVKRTIGVAAEPETGTPFAKVAVTEVSLSIVALVLSTPWKITEAV